MHSCLGFLVNNYLTLRAEVDEGGYCKSDHRESVIWEQDYISANSKHVARLFTAAVQYRVTSSLFLMLIYILT